MKNLFLIFCLSLFSFSALAQEDHSALAAPMKIIGEQFKVLAAAVQSQNFTQGDYQAVETMQIAIADASLVYPLSATDDAAKLQYSRWMAELMKMAMTLETQAKVVLKQEPQNMADVTQTLMDMNELRKEAHEVFKTTN